ncbi:hypothetical protein [Nocardia sp. N2S4-5]|uniref:hypothetical protein n=1 Tax=Nocardia sp. N2S4-5 TaxID=3351565 RepID=UPI0037CF765E
MPRRLSKRIDVPANHEQLIDMLWRFYIAANDPPIREIARAIEELDETQLKGTANHETIRRTLIATTLPTWPAVEVIFLALCQIADIDPDDIEPDGEYDRWNTQPRSHRDRPRTCFGVVLNSDLDINLIWIETSVGEDRECRLSSSYLRCADFPV